MSYPVRSFPERFSFRQSSGCGASRPVPTFEGYMQFCCIPTISSGEIAADTDLPKAKSATEAEADKVPWKEKKWKSKSEKV